MDGLPGVTAESGIGAISVSCISIEFALMRGKSSLFIHLYSPAILFRWHLLIPN
jgi:hypothetical protein